MTTSTDQPVGTTTSLWTQMYRYKRSLQGGFRIRKRRLFLGLVLLELAYIFVSVPFRLGFFFDPYASSDWRVDWTFELTVFSILDVLAEMAAFASFMDIFATQRRHQAARAANAMVSLGTRRSRSTRRVETSVSRPSVLAKLRDSMQVVWSLNTMTSFPTGHDSTIHRPLLFELVAMVPLELLAIQFGPNSLHILRLLKLFRLYRVPRCFHELRQVYHDLSLVQRLEYTGNAVLVKTVLLGLGSAHWLACGYMIVAHVECGMDFMRCSKAHTISTTFLSNTETNHHGTVRRLSPRSDGSTNNYTCWAIEDYLIGTSVGRQYGRAIYWASRSIVTAGFYDVAATTNLETLYAICAQLVGAIFSTAVLATFLFIFRYRNARRQAFMAHVDRAHEYMRSHQFPVKLRERVLGYYKHAWATHQALHQDQVMERVPGHLKLSVDSVLKAQRIHQVAFLTKLSIELINTLALRLDLCVYCPNDWISETVPDAMFFVVRGIVHVHSEAQSQTRAVKAGEHFAESSLLFPGRVVDEQARAQTYCDLYKLRQRCFATTLTIFYREQATEKLDEMRAMHARHDQQEQKMKRMLGHETTALEGFCGRPSGLVETTGRQLQQVRIPWRLPNSTFRTSWEQMRLVAIVFIVFEVPIYCVFRADTFPFGMPAIYSVQSLLAVLVESFFVLDLVFRAHFFAFIDPVAHITVTDPTYIFETYRKTGFWLDLVTIQPLPLLVEFLVRRGYHWTLGLHLTRLVRFFRARYLQKTIHEVAHIRGLSSKTEQAGTMLLYVTLTLHLAGCLWFLMARLSLHEGAFQPIVDELSRERCLYDAGRYGNCSWTMYDAYGQIGTTFVVQDPYDSIYTDTMAYLRSIYWAIVALTTVGYGDIVAFSTYESYFAAVWIFIGGIINYGVVGAMSNIISNYTAASRHHSEKMNTINVTLGHFRVSESVRARIREFYHQQLYAQKLSSEVELLEGLPTDLRHRISSLLHATSVRKVPLFIDAQNEQLLYELTGLFRRRVFQRGDPFFPDGTRSEEMYVIVNGRANIYSKQVTSVPIGAISEGDCFGVCELILQKSRTTSVIAATVVDASVITYSAFVSKIERHFPTEMEALRRQAMHQHVLDTMALDAVVENIKVHPTLAKFTEQCTSMFVEKENWSQVRRKMRFRLLWDLLLLALDVYTAFQVTFRISFLAHPSHTVRLVLVIVDFLGDAILLLDIYLKMYYFECEGVGPQNLLSRQERSTTYTGRALRGDLVSSLPLYYVGTNFFVMSLCRLPRLLRLYQIPGMIDSLIMRLQQRFAAGGNISAVLSPIKLVLILLFTSHFAACVFYMICHTDANPKNWTHHDPIVHFQHESTGVLYLRAFYWALTTLTLVGSREIVPLAIPGTLWATFTCLCCAFIVGHIVGELSELILEMDHTKKELQERESHFETFAKTHTLPASLRTRVQQYLTFQHQYLKGMDLDATFRDLSPNLRVQLMMDLHGKTLHHVAIAPLLTQSQIHGLAVRFKSELSIPGDNLIVEGDLGHKLYLLRTGMASVLWKSTGTAVATLQAGSVFGEVAFFLRGQRRIATVQATACSEVLVLGRRAWEDLLALSSRQEAKATERALIQWVKYCLKGYNISTVEIVKEIKSRGKKAIKKKKPQRDDDEEEEEEEDAVGTCITMTKTPVTVRRKERGKTGGYIAFNSSSGFLSQHWRWSVEKLVGTRRKRARLGRVYADNSVIPKQEEQEQEEEQSESKIRRPVPSSRRLFSWYTAQSPNAASNVSSSPFNKIQSLKRIATLRRLSLRLNLRDVYRDENELLAMEDECWRRYKVSLFMADTLLEENMTSPIVSLPAALQPQQALPIPVPLNETSKTARNSRKTFCGAMLSGGNPTQATRSIVTTDGMRFLANYEAPKRPFDPNFRRQFKPRTSLNGMQRLRKGHGVFHHSFQSSKSPPGAARAHRRQRKLQRSQSLPLFDRHFAAMLQEELQDSNAKEPLESKRHRGIDVRDESSFHPVFSSLFHMYRTWFYHWKRWTQWSHHQLPRFTTSASFAHFNLQHHDPFQSQRGLRFDDLADRHVHSHSSHITNKSASSLNQIETFQHFLARCYRLWEWLVVLVGTFYAVAIPFFLCFASDTAAFDATNGETSWLRLVLVVDFVCVLDTLAKHSGLKQILRLNGDENVKIHSAARFARAHPPPLALMRSTRALKDVHHAITKAPKRWRGKPRAFWLDVLTSVPFDLLLYFPPLSTSFLVKYRWFYLAVFQLNKVPRIFASIDLSKRLIPFLGSDLKIPLHESRLPFLHSVSIYILWGHWIACLWFRVSLSAYAHYHESWLSTNKMLPVDMFHTLSEIPTKRRYLRSLHFAIGSITTNFYGDVVSMNVVECIVEIAFIVVCILIFGVLVGAQAEMIEANYKHKMLFEQQIQELYQFLKTHDVPRDVRQRLQLYYTNTWLTYHGHDDYLEGLYGLSTLLIEDIIQYTLRDFANQISILKSCDESFLRALLTCLKPIICSASEAVVRKGDVDRSMYFIAKGKVVVKGPGFELVKNEGDFFGELSLLYGIPRSATCLSLATSLLYVLEWETYEQLLADYPEYREQNRREWVIVSTVLKTGESRFRSIIDIVARMEKTNWVRIDEIIRKAKSLK